VKDVLSHLVGFEKMLHGEAYGASRGVAAVRAQSNWRVQRGLRAGQSRATGPRSTRRTARAVRAFDRRASRARRQRWEKVGWSPEGERPYHRFQETRVVDSWIHLQDIRDALLQPEDDHGPGEEIVVNRFESALPYIVGKRMKSPDGTLVRVNLSGRLARSVLIGVVDGRALALNDSADTPTLEITTPVALFWRRAAGRISAAAFLAASATDVRGDRVIAGAFADSLVIMI